MQLGHSVGGGGTHRCGVKKARLRVAPGAPYEKLFNKKPGENYPEVEMGDIIRKM